MRSSDRTTGGLWSLVFALRTSVLVSCQSSLVSCLVCLVCLVFFRGSALCRANQKRSTKQHETHEADHGQLTNGPLTTDHEPRTTD